MTQQGSNPPNSGRTATGPVLPGGTIGVLGSGQLGRMMAIAARRLGYRVAVFSPEANSPTAQVADIEVVANYDELDRVAEFARTVDVLTFEFENVAAAATETAAQFTTVRPAGRVLHTTQHRLREKGTLRAAGLPVTPFLPVHSLAELRAALATLGAPAVLKTASWGYDGKGQVKIARPEEAETAWQALKTDEAILEQMIDFEGELSVVGVRSVDGDSVTYGPMHNTHANHILDLSVFPAALPQSVADAAITITHEVLRTLDVIGVLCVEFFLTRDHQLLINETAPRPHNSGHLTIECHATSQFEQQVRAVCGLPLGSAQPRSAGAMANLLGHVWSPRPPNWLAALRFPSVNLHLYGKQEPRPGRKMGHLTAWAPTSAEAVAEVQAARAALQS